jgi:four helix bundle protein
MPFLFRNLDVYQQSTAFVREADSLASQFRPHDSDLADQLRRAAQKVPSQIAEGFGRWHVKDKVHLYRLALGSVNECVGHLDVALQRKLISESVSKTHCENLDRIAQMLQRLIQSVFSRQSQLPG